MLGGEYKHNLDAKNRIFIPSKLREELGEPFVVAKDIRENCLKVYSLEGWEAYIRPLREQKRSLSEKIVRHLHASLAQVMPDGQGRIVLPPELIAHAKLEKNIVVVGCCDYAEIWAESVFVGITDEQTAAFAELYEEADLI